MDINTTCRYLDSLAALGVSIPESTATARAVFEAALNAAAEHPGDDLRAAFESGAVTPANAAEMVRQAAATLSAQQYAHQLVRDLHIPINRAMNQGLRDDFDRIHTELAAVFAPAAAGVHKGAKHFGPDTTAAEVLDMSAEAIKQWRERDHLTATLDAVGREYRSLVSEVVRFPGATMVSLFIGETDNLDRAAYLYNQPNRWLALAAEGYDLRLNTPDQARAVVEACKAKEAAKAAAEREAQVAAARKKNQRWLGVGAGVL